MKTTETTFTVEQLGDEFAVISPSGNVHSTFSTLADAEAAAVRISNRETARRKEYSY